MAKKPASSKVYAIIYFIKEYGYIGIAALSAYLLGGVIFLFGIIPTGSMSPNYGAGSLFAGYRLIDETNLERGTAVTFYFEDIILLKRVIGLPGDTVTFQEGSVYINGVCYDESDYLSSDVLTWPRDGYEEFQVPEGCYFMLGDNRTNSYDSRYWDEPYVEAENIIATVLGAVETPLFQNS